jgi:signal transduction histidine kinase
VNASSARPGGFGSEDVAKLERLAQQVALVLDNLELLRSLQTESERLEDLLENLAEGVIVLEGGNGDSLMPEAAMPATLSSGRANAAARALLNLPERFTPAQLPAQVRASLEQDSSSLIVGTRRVQVLTKRVASRTVVVLQDVSAFEAVERAKAEFLGIVSHELRTPLTAIIGFTELMLSGAVGSLSTEQDQFLNTTLTASKNLHQTVQNLLIASNLEAGLFELHPRLVRLNLRKTLERFKNMAADKNLRFTLDLPEPGRVYVDAERIGLVLENLVSNAVRYTPSGGTIEVRASIEHNTLEASISDSGGGLRPEQEERLFEKFTRDTRNTQEGAGIGLYVSSAIVRACGGRLWAQNEPGHGLRMHLRVPLLEPEEDAAAPSTTNAPRA